MEMFPVDVSKYLQADADGITLWMDPEWPSAYREQVVATLCDCPMFFTLRIGKRPSAPPTVKNLPTIFIDSEMPESDRQEALKVISKLKAPAKIAIMPMVAEDAVRIMENEQLFLSKDREEELPWHK